MSEPSSTRAGGNVIRTADLLWTRSLAGDLAMGLHTEHGARARYFGMNIAQEIGLPLEQRTDPYYAELRGFIREGCESTCIVASRSAQGLGMSPAVQDALTQVFEQWDGHGMPCSIKNDVIPVIPRIVLVASFLEAFHRVDGRDSPKQAAVARHSKAFDPSVVDAFLSVAQRDGFWTGLERRRANIHPALRLPYRRGRR